MAFTLGDWAGVVDSRDRPEQISARNAARARFFRDFASKLPRVLAVKLLHQDTRICHCHPLPLQLRFSHCSDGTRIQCIRKCLDLPFTFRMQGFHARQPEGSVGAYNAQIRERQVQRTRALTRSY